MFNIFTSSYSITCPVTGSYEAVAVSDFRRIERLPGASEPAIYKITYACSCGGEHPALLSHDELDWQPLGHDSPAVFTNVLTGAQDLASADFGAVAQSLIRKGQWPWMFYCYAETQMQPSFPSFLQVVSPLHETRTHRHCVLVRCTSCQRLSINVVSQKHLDVPFYNDDAVQYVDAMIGDERMTTVEAFRSQLDRIAPHHFSWIDSRAA